MRAGLLSPTLRSLRDIGFLDAVKKGQLAFVVFHILGSSIASLNEIEDTSVFAADAKYFLVKNFINNTSFFKWDQATQPPYFRKFKDAVGSLPNSQPHGLQAGRARFRSVSLTFVANKLASGDAAVNPSCCAAMLQHWLGNVWASTSPR